MITAADVVELLETLGGRHIEVRLAGGWGVDALAGRQTREHRDLDVLVLVDQLAEALDLLGEQGFETTTDWLPVRVEVSDGRRHVDVHPLHLGDDGSGWQAGLDGTRFDYPADVWTSGRIGGRVVTCLTADHQRLLHSGYEPREQDLHDLDVLASLLGRFAGSPDEGTGEGATMGDAQGLPQRQPPSG